MVLPVLQVQLGAFQLCGQTRPCPNLGLELGCTPQVQGFAARYEQVGDPEALAATAQFFGLLLQVWLLPGASRRQGYRQKQHVHVPDVMQDVSFKTVADRCVRVCLPLKPIHVVPPPQHHSFSTGGSNWYEHWAAEDSLGEALSNVSGWRWGL